MSRDNDKKRQAQELFRAFTEIDDRFLMEAMGEEYLSEVSAEYDPDRVQVKLSKTEQNPDIVQVKLSKTEQDPEQVQEKQSETEQESDRVQVKLSEIKASDSGRAGAGVKDTDDRPENHMNETAVNSQSSDRVDFKTTGGTKNRRSRLRRFSSLALTAAACLAVIVVGRYVSVSSVKMKSEGLAIESERRGDGDQESVSDAVERSDSHIGKTSDPQAAQWPDSREEDSAQDVMSAQAADEAEKAEKAEKAEEAVVNGEDEDSLEMNAAQDVMSAQASGESAAVENYVSDENAAVSNPFIDVKTIEEAERAAGFEIRLPQAVSPYDTVLYRVMKGEMIEAVYLDGNGNEGYRIRKAVNASGDISGSYKKYEFEDTLKTEDGITVFVKGEKKDVWSEAVWSQSDQNGDDYSFAVIAGARTFTSKELFNMISEMTLS